MKKLAFIFSMIAGISFAVNYTADTFGSADQSYEGRIVAKYFSYATGAVAHSNDTIILTDIPANAMIVRGEISVSAMGGSQTFDVGLMGADGSGYYTGTTTNDTDLLLDGISCANAVNDTFSTLENGDAVAPLELGNRPVYLTITAAGSVAWSTNETVKGVVYYIEP